MKTVSINLYHFAELSKRAKQKAIEDHAIFLNEVDPQGRNFTKKETIEAIEMNGYWFFEDGDMAHCTEYTGMNPLSGKEEFHFHGHTYDITG